jgi:hypothetical protein
MKRSIILISSFSVLIILLPTLSVYVYGQNMTKDDDKDDDDDFLIYGKSLFGLSIKYPVSAWIVEEEGERGHSSIMEQQPIKVQNVLTQSKEQQKQHQGNQDAKIYKDETYGFQFEYPPSTVDIVEDRLLTMSDLQLAHVFFEGQFRSPYLTIKIYTLSPNEKTLNDFTSRIVKIKETPNLNNNVSILRSEATTLAGKPAHELEYIDKYYIASENNTSSSKKSETRNLSVWTIDNNQAYELEFTGTSEKYKKHLPSAERIIKSFQIYK